MPAYSKLAFAKHDDRKTPITAADLLNDRAAPFFEAKEVKLSHVPADRGTQYCGNPEPPEHELYLAVEDIDHSSASHSIKLRLAEPLAGCARTRAKSPRANGIVARLTTISSKLATSKKAPSVSQIRATTRVSERADGMHGIMGLAFRWATQTFAINGDNAPATPLRGPCSAAFKGFAIQRP